MMMIGGIRFPYDRTRLTTGHGPLASFIMRLHPLALWAPFMAAGGILGWYFHAPVGW